FKKILSHYNEEQDYLDVLKLFLFSLYQPLDRKIRLSASQYFKDRIKDNTIARIPGLEFNKRHDKVQTYMRLRNELDLDNDDFAYKEEKPSKLLSISISDYGKINELELAVGDKKNRWIFLTGENGSGKTNLLRAIGTVLGYRTLSEKELGINTDFSIEAHLLFKNSTETYRRGANLGLNGKRKPLVQGLAMYGPYRLDVVQNRITQLKFHQELSKQGLFKPLFKSGAQLLSIDRQFFFWKQGSEKERLLFEKRFYFIKTVFTDIVPGLVDIDFGHSSKEATHYVFRNPIGESYALQWDDLSSGTKSTIALVGDILVRLYNQQRDILDPSELRGVVIIDEIDLHLHPQAQKDLVINLSNTFSNLQFIASTHSPIPILGAPRESVFFRVSRDSKDNISLERLSNIEKNIGRLLPNHLFTSNLFGLQSLHSIQTKDLSTVYTGSTMSDFNLDNDLNERNQLKNPDDAAFLESLKARWNEEG
ncbi:AAA family ATPase, partial [Flavobacteriales bacterium]|nr:AAA family ATPase [Flavobacteriales bacterium]